MIQNYSEIELKELVSKWRDDENSLFHSQKLTLLSAAADYYYNTDVELLSDEEYDRLEKSLNLDNVSEIAGGSKHTDYTIKHPFIMGSICKVHAKRDKAGNMNWQEILDGVNKYISKAHADFVEVTPKLDGCSFEVNIGNDIVQASTRGDGQYGKSILPWFMANAAATRQWKDISKYTASDNLIVRGEVLVPKSVYEQSYSTRFKNTRAMVAGSISSDWEDTPEQNAIAEDLVFMCYDYRTYDNLHRKYTEIDFLNENDKLYNRNNISRYGRIIDFYDVLPLTDGKLTMEQIKYIYERYENYRINECDFSLDGIVFKPTASSREYNTEPRPADCVALKFVQQMETTEIVNIEWNVGKTGELCPVAITAPVYMDGKTITRASLHNYNYLVERNVGIGSQVKISLAGDIIPFVYEVVSHSSEYNLPDYETEIEVDEKSGCQHLMKVFTPEEQNKNEFLSSADALAIPGIGPKVAEKLYDAYCESGRTYNNIVYLMQDSEYEVITELLGKSKSTDNIISSLKEYLPKMTLSDLIRSFCFPMCGHKASDICARIISGLQYDTTSIPSVAYAWALNTTSIERYFVESAMNTIGIDIMEDDIDAAEQIPIKMTGEPSNTKYKTKAQWLAAHPQYRETTSEKEMKILFTNDLSSNSGKMQKARKKGIEIRLYED